MKLIEIIYQKLNEFAFIFQKDFQEIKKIVIVNRKRFAEKSFNLFKKKFLESLQMFNLEIEIKANSLNLMEIGINLFSISVECVINSQTICMVYQPIEMNIFYSYNKCLYLNGGEIKRQICNNQMVLSSDNVLFGHNLMLVSLCIGEIKEIIIKKEHMPLNKTGIFICQNINSIKIEGVSDGLRLT